MADHIVTLTQAQEKALVTLTDAINAERAGRTPPLPSQTTDEFLYARLEPMIANMQTEAGATTEAPIIAGLRKVIALGDAADIAEVAALVDAKLDAKGDVAAVIV